MTRIGIIAGSTRPGALNPQVVAWVKAQLDEAGVENGVVNFGDYDLPVLDEEIPGGAHMYANEHTKAWGAAVEPFDGYIVVTPEYNHSVPGPLKNAIDFIGSEFANKPVAFASYGADKGVRLRRGRGGRRRTGRGVLVPVRGTGGDHQCGGHGEGSGNGAGAVTRRRGKLHLASVT